MGVCGLEYSGSGYVQVTDFCEHDDEHSDYIVRNFLTGLGIISYARRTVLHTVG